MASPDKEDVKRFLKVLGKSKGDKVEEPKEDRCKVAAEAILEAIEGKDAEALAEALKAFVEKD